MVRQPPSGVGVEKRRNQAQLNETGKVVAQVHPTSGVV